MSRLGSRLVFWLAITVVLVVVVHQISPNRQEDVSYDRFVDLMKAGRLERIALGEDRIEGTYWDEARQNTIQFRTSILPSAMSYVVEMISDYRNTEGANPFEIRQKAAPTALVSPFWWAILFFFVAVLWFLWQRGKDKAPGP